MKTQLLTLCACLGLANSIQAQETTYRKDVAPIIKAHCFDCHDSSAPSLVQFKTDEEGYKKQKLGPRLDTYMDMTALIVWPDTGAFMRRLDDGTSTPDKKPGNMYKYLGEAETARQTNLAVLKAWLGENAWNLNRWQKRGDVPAITKEQLDLLKLKY